MRTFVTRAGGFLAIQLVIGVVLFGLYLRTADPAGSYLRGYVDKTELLADPDGPKLVLVGGSNVALGFDSEALDAALPNSPVNAGLMKGIGTPMMLAQVEPHLRSGDVVLLSPEYDQLVQRFDPHTVFRLLEDSPEALGDVPASYLPALLDDSLTYFGQALRSMFGRGGRGRTHAPPYTREGFNRFGDMVRHRDLPIQEPLATPLRVPSVEDEVLHDAVETLNSFFARVERRGVTVLLSFPPLPDDVYATREEELRAVHGYLREELSIPLLDTPEEMALPRRLFYDTIYHLNRKGIERRMEHLIPRLRDALADS